MSHQTIVELDMTELACRIAEASMGVRRPIGRTASQALAQADNVDPGAEKRWRNAAAVAAEYIAGQICAGKRVQ